MSKIYKDTFSSWADVCGAFGHWDSPLTEPEPDAVFAVYDIDGYEGSAFVLFRRGENLFVVEGSHCSCYGLEGLWKPDPMPQAAVQKMVDGASYGIMDRYKDDLRAWLSGQSAA